MSTSYENGVYSFQDVHFSIVGPNLNVTVTGVADEGYTVEFDGDKNTLVMGADGSGMTSLRAAQNGLIMVRLLKTGILNAALCNAYNFQTTSAANSGQNVIVINDPVRGDTVNGFGASFRRFPNISYATEGGTQEWVFVVPRISPKLGAGLGLTING